MASPTNPSPARKGPQPKGPPPPRLKRSSPPPPAPPPPPPAPALVKRPPPPAAEPISGEEAADLHVLGTRLSERIVEFQSRFAALKRKCDHSVTEPSQGCVTRDRLGPHSRGVGFRRDGKEWKLFFVETGKYRRERTQTEMLFVSTFMGGGRKYCEDDYEQWEELTDVSLVKKSVACKLLPRLWKSMQEEYGKRRSAVSEALLVLDDLDSELPAGGGE